MRSCTDFSKSVADFEIPVIDEGMNAFVCLGHIS